MKLCAAALGSSTCAWGKDTYGGAANITPSKPLDAATYRAIRRSAQLPFGKIAYIDRGTGDTALFLHGAPLNSFQWRGVIHRLSTHRRCVAPDFMGLGYSEVCVDFCLALRGSCSSMSFVDVGSLPAVPV
jgi:pimeloyl-ACP methyl ester carboxylesterase